MPLDVMLHIMRQHLRDGKLESAVELAKAAAPYLHARGGARRDAVTLSALEDEQLDELCERSVDREKTAGRDTD